MELKCIAVDDEPLALDLIKRFINQTPFLKLSASYDNAIDALRALNSDEPIDLIFLDIQMNDLTGIELARILDGGSDQRKPLMIFTTAFDQYALEGYKVEAVDYLLKPFNYEEFLKAATRALNRLNTANTPEVKPSGSIEKDAFIFLKVEYQLVKVYLKDIQYIESSKDYVKVHLANEKHPVLTLTSLKSMEEKLDPKQFMRIHRSYLVNIHFVKSVTRNALQIENTTLTISESYRDHFHQIIGSGL